MYQLHIDYDTLMNMPWETLEWLYNRHLQELIDLKKKREEQHNSFI